MSSRTHHLQDERLFECYLAERSGGPIDPPAAEHLADCDACARRYTDFASLLEEVRADGAAAADEVFTPDRLGAQQQQIARRLEHIVHPARIISFPSRVVRRTMTASGSLPATRWIAAAAAAGLFVGVAVGASYQFGPRAQRLASSVLTLAPGTLIGPPVGSIGTVGSGQAIIASEDQAMSDLELALERPHTRELVAFDAFTPHVRDIRDH
jgi:hypothetical protein